MENIGHRTIIGSGLITKGPCKIHSIIYSSTVTSSSAFIRDGIHNDDTKVISVVTYMVRTIPIFFNNPIDMKRGIYIHTSDDNAVTMIQFT